MTAVVIGVGNRHRRDDGIGPAVAAAVAAERLPGVRVLTCAAEPTAILDAWDGADLAVVVDAVFLDPVVVDPAGGSPGRVRCHRIGDIAATDALSSHDLNLVQTYELARALRRAPRRVVVVGVDAADTGYGEGLSPEVAQAVPRAVLLVLAEIEQDEHRRDEGE